MKNIIDYPSGMASKAVILTRVSSKEQEDGHSIEAQKHRLQVYCQRRGLEVIRVFEITESSTRGDRTKFLEMVKFCKAQRQPVAIVADKVDRVQRSFKEYPLLDALIQEGKIELHFNTENYVIHKGSVSQERLMWSFGVIMAQSYTDSLRDNVKRSFDHKIRLGELPAMAPVGYLNVRTEQGKSDVVVDESRAMIIRRIFTEFASGAYTLAEITAKAKTWGLRGKTHSGNALNRSHIYRLLNNPFYYGMMEIKGKAYLHKYPPLVDKATVDKCQAVLKGWNKKPFKYGKMEFVFRGLLTCANANRTISSFTKKKTYKNGDSGEWTYLRSWDKQGKAIYVREEKLLEQAEKALKAMKLSPEITACIKDYLRSTDMVERDFVRRQMEELHKEDKRLLGRIGGLMDLLMDSAITRQEYDSRKAQLCERQIEIGNLLAAQREGDDGFKDSLLLLLDLSNQAADLFKHSTPELKRRLLNSVFSNLTLDEETLCYSYKIPFSAFADTAKTGEWSDLVDRLRTSPDLRGKVIETAKSSMPILPVNDD
jgi:DNA invertase Pin-like site-specific DNA recombinase